MNKLINAAPTTSAADYAERLNTAAQASSVQQQEDIAAAWRSAADNARAARDAEIAAHTRRVQQQPKTVESQVNMGIWAHYFNAAQCGSDSTALSMELDSAVGRRVASYLLAAELMFNLSDDAEVQDWIAEAAVHQCNVWVHG